MRLVSCSYGLKFPISQLQFFFEPCAMFLCHIVGRHDIAEVHQPPCNVHHQHPINHACVRRGIPEAIHGCRSLLLRKPWPEVGISGICALPAWIYESPWFDILVNIPQKINYDWMGKLQGIIWIIKCLFRNNFIPAMKCRANLNRPERTTYCSPGI